MITLRVHIQELRVEFCSCRFTGRERAAVPAGLAIAAAEATRSKTD
jgi:hypothetical protein